MIEQIKHLLSTEYLFHKSLGPFQSNLAYFFVGFCVLIIFLAIILRKSAENKDLLAKKSVKKFGSFAWSMGSIGIILYVFRQINVLYLSAPVFVLIWAIITITWLAIVLKYVFLTAPKRRKELKEEKEKRDYIP